MPRRKSPQVALAEAAMDALCPPNPLRWRVAHAIGLTLTTETTDVELVEAVERFAAAPASERAKRSALLGLLRARQCIDDRGSAADVWNVLDEEIHKAQQAQESPG